LSCIIGSWGWRHPEWENDVFYPDDLPSDWRLSYYSNEFDLVVVPAEYWTEDGYWEDDWLDDVAERFVFYIDWPFQQLSGEADYDKCAEQCRFLSEQMAAILVNNAVWQQLSAEQLQWFAEATKGFKVLRYDVSKVGDVSVREEANIDNLLLLRSNKEESLRDLTGRLTTLLKSVESSAPVEHIVLSNECVDIERLKELDTVMSLM